MRIAAVENAKVRQIFFSRLRGRATGQSLTDCARLECASARSARRGVGGLAGVAPRVRPPGAQRPTHGQRDRWSVLVGRDERTAGPRTCRSDHRASSSRRGRNLGQGAPSAHPAPPPDRRASPAKPSRTGWPPTGLVPLRRRFHPRCVDAPDRPGAGGRQAARSSTPNTTGGSWPTSSPSGQPPTVSHSTLRSKGPAGRPLPRGNRRRARRHGCHRVLPDPGRARPTVTGILRHPLPSDPPNRSSRKREDMDIQHRKKSPIASTGSPPSSPTLGRPASPSTSTSSMTKSPCCSTPDAPPVPRASPRRSPP